MSATNSLVRPRLLVELIVLAALAIAVDLAGLSLFGVETISDAITPFVVIVVGGYLGITLFDYVWSLLFAPQN